jgi:hypothetical protein
MLILALVFIKFFNGGKYIMSVIISLTFSGIALIIDVLVLVKLVKATKALEDIKDCYIDVNMDILMRDDKDPFIDPTK